MYGMPYHTSRPNILNAVITADRIFRKNAGMADKNNMRRNAFKTWMALQGTNTSQVAKRSGVKYTTLASYVQGDTHSLLGRTEAQIASAFGTTVGVIFQNEPEKAAANVPVIGLVQAGGDAILFSEGQGPFDQVPSPAGATAATVAVRVNGTCLGRWMDRGLVFYDDVRNPVTEDLLGRLCVIGLPDGRVLVKELRASKTPNAYHLFSAFEDPILDQIVQWAARVTNIVPP